MCIFDRRNNIMYLFIQQIKKIVSIQAALPAVTYISNKSGAIEV